MKHTLIFIISVSVLFCCHAQVALENFDELEKFDAMEFRSIGPTGMSGRVTAIDVDLSDKHRIFIGSASGGVWKSENGGTTWDPIFDDQPTLSIGALKINQNNPAEIWVGTGEGNPRNSHNSGKGIFKSIDGGKTWMHLGLEKTKLIHRIIINPKNTNEVLVGALGSAWGPSEDRGVYKTVDGGETWNKILYVNEETGVADMVQDPKNPNKIIAAMWEFGRKPWTFNSGGEGSGMYLTYDGGKNWKKLSEEEGMPKGELGRIGLAIAPSKPNIVYALIEAEENGLYKSTDGGENWSLVSKKNIGNRPFYYAEIYVDPGNENRIFNLWSYVSKSEDGGKTFKNIMDYGNSVHPDHHAWWSDPDDPNYLIDGNDGGLNISRDGGANWYFVPNLPLGQFYHVDVDNDFPYNVYGGMQDNGSWVGPGFTLKRGGINMGDWQELYFGDGFDVAPLKHNNRYGYAMSQGGNIGKWDKETGHTEFIKPMLDDTIQQRFHWNAALALDPFSNEGLYYASQFLHYSPDMGQSWKTLSGDLTTNDPEKQKQDISGGLTIDATNAENYCTIIAIAPCPHDNDAIWVGTDDGNLHITKDRGENWNNVYAKLSGAPKGGWIAQIEVSKINKGEAFIVINNFRQDDWSAYLYHTKDYGATFKRIVNDAQVPDFVCSVVQDSEQENLLFLGTDVGLYVSFDYGSNWQKWGDDLPNVQVRDMKIQSTFGDLVLGTFGRAFWVLDDINPLRKIAKDGKAILDEELVLFDPPASYKAYKRSYQGIRFYAQAYFEGENKGQGANIRYWLKPKVEEEKDIEVASEETKKKNKKLKDKAAISKTDADASTKDNEDKGDGNKDKEKEEKTKPTLLVINKNGDTIRTLKPELKEGLNQINWRLDAKGVRGPSREEIKDDVEQGGTPIPPGDYKLVLTKDDLKDSCVVTVLRDPRMPMDDQLVKKGIDSTVAFNELIENSGKAFDQLTKAKKTIGLVNKILETQEDSIQKDFMEVSKDLNTKIDSLNKLYMMPKDVKGIQRNPNNLSSMIWRARFYLRATEGPPSPNGEIVIKRVKSLAQEIIDGGNEFFETDWMGYKKKFEALDLDIFGDFEPVKIE